jgi:hypothetical protein
MRRKLMLILLFCLTSLQSFAQNSKPIDVVFDIDWTTFYSIEEPLRDGQTVAVEGKFYRPTDYLPETIEWLLKTHPEVRISFFSGGEKSRNETLLGKVHLSDGRSLRDIAHQIFSKQDLYIASTDSKLSFSERYKKDLATFITDNTADRMILIDDQVNFAKPPLKAVPSLGLYNFQPSFDSSKAGKDYFPPTEKAWSLERNKALLWAAALDSALNESASGKISFESAVQNSWSRDLTKDLSLAHGKTLIRAFSARACEKIFAF